MRGLSPLPCSDDLRVETDGEYSVRKSESTIQDRDFSLFCRSGKQREAASLVGFEQDRGRLFQNPCLLVRARLITRTPPGIFAGRYEI